MAACAFTKSTVPFADSPNGRTALSPETGHFFSWLTRWFWGRHVEVPAYFLTRWIFLRALGVIYLVAFVSLWTQISGLIGHNGILPADQFMSAARQQCDAQGIGLERYHLLPTLCWFDSSDGFLHFQCAAGSGAGRHVDCRHCARAVPRLAVVVVSFARHRLAGIFSVFNGTICCSKPDFSPFSSRRCNGCRETFARNAAVANRALAVAVAVVQAHVFVRLREAV